MVLPGERDYMSTTTARSKKSLHNFSLPNLKWGSHRNLRCMKIDSNNNGGSVTTVGDHRLRRRSSPFRFTGGGVYNRNRGLETEAWRSSENGGEEGIEEFRVKIMSDLKTVADKMTESMFRKHEEEEELESPEKTKKRKKEREVSPPGVTVEVRPWNLRKRRAACKAPITELGIVEEKSSLGYEFRSKEEEEEEGSKFVSILTKKEIEFDYMVMVGHRPPRRPKKRPRTIQRQVDTLYPAFYFTSEITQDMYKVPEATENVKR